MKPIEKLWAWALGLAGLLAAAELFYLPAFNDELEHAHAAWLMSQGLRPYLDFFEQHTPAIWQALAAAFKLDPSAGPGVLFWGRFLCLVSLAASTWLVGSLTLALSKSRWKAWAASTVWVSFAFVADAATIRPELIGLPLALGALRLGVARLSGDRRRRGWRAFASAALASAACYAAPRAAFFALALALGWAFLARPSAKEWAAAAAGSLLGPALVLAFVGAEGWRWVSGFARHILPAFAVYLAWWYYPAKWWVLAGAALALWRAVRPLSPADRLIAWTALAGAAAALLDRRAFAQSFLFVLAPSIALLSAELRGAAWTAAALAWLLPCAMAHAEQFDRAEGLTLARQVEGKRAWSARLAGETVLLPNNTHPICARDASYFWHGLHFVAAGTLAAAGLPPHDFAPELERSRPAIVDAEFASLIELIDRTGRVKRWLEANYRSMQNHTASGRSTGTYWVRADFAERLVPTSASRGPAPPDKNAPAPPAR